MVKASRGYRFGTRKKLKSEFRSKFKVTPFLQEFKPKDKVIINLDPSSQKGMPHHRFKGKVGVVTGRRGDSYLIELKVGNKTKKIISRPEHLKPLSNK